MDELAYIKNLSNTELIDIIENIWGFEETSEALRHLVKRDPQKSLELGKDILQNNKGDDYLQGIVWIMILEISPKEVVDSLTKRQEVFDKVLLRDILSYLSTGYYVKDLKQLPNEFFNKIIYSYETLDKNDMNDDMRIELSEDFDEVIQKIKA